MAEAADKIENEKDDAQRLLLTEIGDKISGGKKIKVFKSIYKADKEVDVNDFHDKCDSKGPTVTLLRGKHNTLFGGYTSQHWLSTDKQVRKRDTEAFLFYRNLNQKGKCVFIPVKEEKAGEAITCHVNFGPTFGGSSKDIYDLQVFKQKSKTQSSKTENYMVLNGMLNPGKSYEISNPKETKNEINSGKMDVTQVEVFQVFDDEDELTTKWKKEPEDFEFAKMKQVLIDMEPHPHLGVKQYNILLVGAVGSGKSSFLNTLATVFSEDRIPLAVVGGAPISLTNKKSEYDLKTKDSQTLKIRIIDIRGITDDRGLEPEFRHLLDGRLPSKFEFSEKPEPIEEDQLLEVTLDEEIHLVCYVTTSTGLDSISESLQGHFDFVKRVVARKDLQSAVVVTKMDELCLGIKNDIGHIFKCKKAEDATEKAFEFFRIPKNQIFPIVNYTDETDTKTEIDRLALQALYEMKRLVEAFFKSHADLPKHKGPWESRTTTLYTRTKVKKESERPELTRRRRELTKELSKHNDKELRILCFGPSRSGKSSFIDSVLSTFRHKIRSDATGGNTDESSVTKMFQLYPIKYLNDAGDTERSNIYLADMPGIQEEGGVQLNDAKLIVKGHVANKCRIQNGVSENSKKYINKPQSRNHTIHSVCFVFDLYTFDRLSSSTLSKCCVFKEWLKEKCIPFVVVVTNCDRMSEVVKQNPTRVFVDKRISECKDKLVKLFGVKESKIYPVQNYVDETTTVSHIEEHLLNVIGEVLDDCYDYLEGLQSDEETDEENDENGSEYLSVTDKRSWAQERET